MKIDYDEAIHAALEKAKRECLDNLFTFIRESAPIPYSTRYVTVHEVYLLISAEQVLWDEVHLTEKVIVRILRKILKAEFVDPPLIHIEVYRGTNLGWPEIKVFYLFTQRIGIQSNITEQAIRKALHL